VAATRAGRAINVGTRVVVTAQNGVGAVENGIAAAHDIANRRWGDAFTHTFSAGINAVGAGAEVKSFFAKPRVLGGAYEDVRAANKGGQVHHTPASSVISPLPPERGPSFHMDTKDHINTASFGGKQAARQYRAAQERLIVEGRWKDAIQMDIDDVRSKFGSKYDVGIGQMLKYARSIGLIE